jgi:hypothetical protein
MTHNQEKPEGRTTYHTPRWVKVFAIIVLTAILLVAIILATGIGGPHGPARHLPSYSPTVEVQPL